MTDKDKAIAKAEARAEIRRLFGSANITTVFTATVDSWDSDGRFFALRIFAFDPRGLGRDWGGSAKIELTRLTAKAFDAEIDEERDAIIVDTPNDPVHWLGAFVFGTDKYSQLRHEVLL